MQRRQRAGGEKLVGKPDLPERRMDARAHQQRRHGFAEAADHGVVLGDDDEAARLARLAQDRLGVERLDRRHVQDGGVDAVIRQGLGCLQRAHGHDARGDDQDVGAVAQQRGLAELEAVIVLVEHQRHLSAQQPHIDRSAMRGDGRHDLLDLVRIAGSITVMLGIARNSARSSAAWWLGP